MYQNPVFYTEHLFRRQPASVVSGNGDDPLTPIGLLMDSRQFQLYRFGTSANDHTLDLFPLTDGLTLPADRLIIPDGHDLAGATVEVLRGFDLANLVGVMLDTVTAGLYVSPPFSSAIGNTAWRVAFSGLTGQWSLGECTLTLARQFNRGPEPSWRQGQLANVFRNETQAGVASSRVLGASRLTWRATWSALYDADVDTLLAMLDDIGGAALPFYFLPPDTRYSVGLYEMARPQVEVEVEALLPTGEPRYRLVVDIVEALG